MVPYTNSGGWYTHAYDWYTTTNASGAYMTTATNYSIGCDISNTSSATDYAILYKWTNNEWCRYTYPPTAGIDFLEWKYTALGNEFGKARIASPHDRLRQIIQDRQAPLILGTRKSLEVATDVKEVRARETLLRVLGEDKFRGFIRNGFVSVRGKSGKTYQIFPGHGITKVYQHGKLVERLCVVLTGSFPPTDSLIMRFLLILNDEEEFRSLAIKHGVNTSPITRRVKDLRPLPEIFRSLVA